MNNDSIVFQNNQDQEIKRSLSEAMEALLEIYKKQQEKETIESVQPRIKVNEVLSSVAFIYERIRNVLDYKGEHLLRRNAIERILRRLLWRKESTPTILGNTLIRELIWARYLKNDSIPKGKVDEVSEIISKYLKLFNQRFDNQWRKWLLGIASCEIEEILVPALFYIDAYTKAMYLWFKENFEWQNEDLSPKEKDIQIFIAIHRSLPKSDNARIRYHLLKHYYPDWQKDVFKTYKKIEEEINYPLRLRIYRLVQKYTAPFQILKDLIDEERTKARKILENPEKLEWKVKEICNRRYAQIQTKVNRGIVRSIIYILVTKVFLAFLTEVPYEIFIIKKVNPIPIAINAIIPPGLMFLVGLTIRKPDDSNTKRIIERIKSFVYPKKGDKKITFSFMQIKKKKFIERIFFFLYSLLFIVIFGGIAFILMKLHFNIFSALIFFVFLSLVLLFSLRLRFTASELIVTGEKENLFSHLFTNLTLPFLNLGVWLSQSLSQLNVFMVLMDFLIEAPLKNIIEIVEEWASFIKEKKEEVIEVPRA